MDIELKHEITPEIINALCQSYFAAFVVDFKTDAYKTLFIAPWLKAIPEHGKYSFLLSSLINKFLRGDDCGRVARGCSIDNFRDQLSKKYQTPEGGVNFYIDYRSYREGFDFRYCRANACPLEYGDDDKASRALVMLQDITALKAKELEEQNRNQQSLEALCVDYAAAYLVDLVNDTMEQIKTKHYWDLSRILKNKAESLRFSQWVKLSWDELLKQDSCPNFCSSFSANQLRAFLSKHDVFATRVRSKPDKLGNEWFEIKVVKLFEDANSYKVIVGYRAIDDIVAAELERQVMVRQNKQSEIIAAMATIYASIFIIDLETREYELIENKTILHFMTGQRGHVADVVDNIVEHLVIPDHQEAMRKFLDFDTLAERLAFKNIIETVYQNVNGHWYTPSFIVKKRDEHGRAEKVLYVCRDVTEDKQHELQLQQELRDSAEEAKRANISKTDFLRRMSHDIRTPLNGIIGMMHIVEKFDNEPNKRRYCREKIINSAEYLMDLVNNVLDISKLESGVLTLDDEPFNLGKQLFKLIDIVEQNANENGISFEGGASLSHIVHRNVIGSPVLLNRILMNIASNAIKYNRRGGMLRVSCNEISCDGNIAVYEFECVDNGLGMSKNFLARAFEPFSQEGKETTTTFTGSGLGLSIVKDIAELMGGKVELESKENVGTKVKVTLPLRIDNENEEASKKEQIDLKSIKFVGKKALLVEDNGLNMEIATIMLEELGFKITPAYNGQDALEIFEKSAENEFDIIFMDMMMPVMDGLEASRHLRSMLRVDAKTIPIIAMTANAFAEDKESCLGAGMTDHVGKPIDIDLLKQTIINYLPQS